MILPRRHRTARSTRSRWLPPICGDDGRGREVPALLHLVVDEPLEEKLNVQNILSAVRRSDIEVEI